MVKKSKKRKERIDPAKEHRKDRNTILIIAIIAAGVGITVFAMSETSVKHTSSSMAALIDGIPCENTEQVNFHIHAHLDVFVNGNASTVPQNIGIVKNICLYWLHTHDSGGIIHVEAPNEQKFTLMQFFDIWKATGDVAPPIGSPTIYVNGEKTATDPKDVVIKSHDEIAVVYGDPPSSIPTSYKFPTGL